MTTGLFEKHVEKAWLSISQQSVNFVLLMSVATRSLDRWPRGLASRGASGGAVGTVLLLLSSTERPSMSGLR